MSKKPEWTDETQCVHAGEHFHQLGPLVPDITLSSVFVFPKTDDLRKFQQGKSDAYIYTRYSNPTTRIAEEKLAALEGGGDCVVTASGMAAIFCAVMAVCEAGDEILSMLDIYGGTLSLFERALTRMGIRTRLVPFHDIGNIEKYVTKRTRLLFLETPTNPTLRCVDIRRLCDAAHKQKLCVLVDNTFATPILQKPLALGADMVIHSATKYLSGHSDVTAGALMGLADLMEKAREIMKITGGCLDPNASYLLIRGLKTLELRVERACQNAAMIADYLEEHPKVARVMYPGLPSHANYEIASEQMLDYGMMVSCDLKRGGKAAERFIDNLKLWCLAPSLGGVESTVSYPVLSSHVGLTKERLELLDVSPATVRLSVGIEHPADLIEDIEQALEKA
jgi:cystathionine beta-lyase/cystathionine gamma-synthase